MTWTSPTTRADGYVVTASTWNNELVENMKYLHGDSGDVDLSVGGVGYTFYDAIAERLAAVATLAQVASGALPVSSSVTRISSTDATDVANITGQTSSMLLFLRNSTASNIPFLTSGNIITPFALASNSYAWLVYDGSQSKWVCLGVVNNNPGIGYGAGAAIGGTITQTGSRTTGVTLNKICGKITMYATGTWNSGTHYEFSVSNSLVAAADVIVANVQTPGGGSSVYSVDVVNVGATSFTLSVTNVGGVSEAVGPTINFAVIKSSTT